MKKSFEAASELDGYEELQPEDQEKIDQAWETGHVADEDIPDSARKPDAEEEGETKKKPTKKKAKVSLSVVEIEKALTSQQKADVSDEQEDGAEDKPKKKTTATSKKRTKKVDEEDEEAEQKPKKRIRKKAKVGKCWHVHIEHSADRLQDDGDEEKPKKKRAAPKKRAKVH